MVFPLIQRIDTAKKRKNQYETIKKAGEMRVAGEKCLVFMGIAFVPDRSMASIDRWGSGPLPTDPAYFTRPLDPSNP